jgi:DNA-binding NarL/FixJ family response regulator
MVRVVVIDDDPFVCASLQTILNAQQDIEVVAVGSSGPEAVNLYGEHVPDVLLMDIQMAGGDGLGAAEQVLAAHPSCRVVFLTTFADDAYIARALHLGARGYLIKQDVADIAPAVRAVAAGQSVLGDEVVGRMAREPQAEASPGRFAQLGLTGREIQWSGSWRKASTTAT